MSRLRADLDTFAGVPAGSYVLPNTRAVTDNFVLDVAAGDFYTLTNPLTVEDAVTTYANITFAANLLLKIEDEILLVSAVSSPDVTFARAQLGTTAAKHPAGVSIYEEDFNDTTDVTINSDFDNTTDPLTITIADYPNTDLSVNAVIQVESEKMLVAANDGTDATLARAQFGTSAAAHPDDDPVLQLEWADSTDDTAGAAIYPVEADEYAVAPYDGYLVKRSLDDDGSDVDWNALTGFLWYWTGTIVTPDAGRYAVTREPLLWYDEQQPTPPIDADGRINLQLAYQAVIDTLLVSGGAFRVDERGWAFGDPPPTYDESSDTYSGTGILGNERVIVGVNAGVVQFEDRVSDGKRYAGGGNVRLDVDGFTILEGSSTSSRFRWIGSDDGVEKIALSDFFNGTTRALKVEANADASATNGYFYVIVRDNSDENVELYLIKDNGSNGFLAISGSEFAGLSVGFLTTPVLSDGVGIDVNGKLLRLRTSKTPSSASDTGNAGEICWDSSYIYVCTATNTWKRVAISTW